MLNLRHQVALGGAWLHEVDERIIVQGVDVSDGKESISTVSTGGRSGQRVTGRRRDALDIEVRFSLWIRKTDMAARNELMEAVNRWAARATDGEWLTVNYKTNRRARVRLSQAPGEGDLADWTKTYAIKFTAYGVPYWQETQGNSLRVANVQSNDRILFGVGGNTETVLDASFRNTSGSTVNSLTLRTGESRFIFSGLGLANGETLEIGHTEEGVLRILISGSGGTRSAMIKRTTESDHELILKPGTERIRFTADGAGTLNLSVTGRFL